MSRRKSTVNISVARQEDESLALELERLEQETTLVLQEIDHNLSRANAVISEKMVPVLRKYAVASGNVWNHVGFWKDFMEEAADVEIKATSGSAPKTKTTAPAPAREATPDSPDFVQQIQASTPHAPRMSLSSRGTPRHMGHSGTPKKTHKQSEDEARRLSILQNFLNSSPTLPEPPVLMSEVGRMATASLSASKPRLESALGRLLPVNFPLSPTIGERSSTQRFPKLPAFGSAVRGQSPVRRPNLEQFRDDSDLPVPKRTAAMVAHDESDELSVPKLQSVLPSRLGLSSSTGVASFEPTSENAAQGSPRSKKRRLSEPENVFLDRSLRAEVVHTAAEQTQPPNETELKTLADSAAPAHGNVSRSMSLIFEEVLAGSASKPPGDSGHQAAESRPDPDNSSSQGLATETQGQRDNTSMEHSINSSELGSFLGERWKTLSKSLRK